MWLSCPECGGGNIRYSYMRSPSERLRSLLGVRPLRCRDCRHRFVGWTWRPADVPYARCPKCWNMKLSTWSPSQYHVPFGRNLRLFLGANPYRCELCRHNFVSFRSRKFRYKSTRSSSQREAVSG